MTEPHVERMMNEQKELSDKLLKLNGFIHGGSDVFGGLEAVERDLLMAQANAMGAYSDILRIRINSAAKE